MKRREEAFKILTEKQRKLKARKTLTVYGEEEETE
jgi:hypothetical protein